MECKTEILPVNASSRSVESFVIAFRFKSFNSAWLLFFLDFLYKTNAVESVIGNVPGTEFRGF